MQKKRILSIALFLALVLGAFAGSASAVDDNNNYREHREEPDIGMHSPDWTEELVECRSGSDVLAGKLTRPDHAEGKLPVAILLHGLGTNSTWCDDIAWCLADNGIASVRFDFAGTGMSGGAQEDMTVGSQVANTLDILRYVKSLDFTDTDNIFLVGKSMGAVDALLANQQVRGQIKALCLWYPAFGITAAVRHGFLLGQFFDPENPPEALEAAGYTYGREFLEETAQLDIESACRSCDSPVLILHGDQDFIAPIFFSFQMEPVFPDCTLQVVPGGYHGFWGFQEIMALRRMTEFLQENIDKETAAK